MASRKKKRKKKREIPISNPPWMPSEFGIIPYRALAKAEGKAFNRRKGYKILAITVPCAEK